MLQKITHCFFSKIMKWVLMDFSQIFCSYLTFTSSFGLHIEKSRKLKLYLNNMTSIFQWYFFPKKYNFSNSQFWMGLKWVLFLFLKTISSNRFWFHFKSHLVKLSGVLSTRLVWQGFCVIEVIPPIMIHSNTFFSQTHLTNLRD